MQALLRAHPGVDVVVSDDGLQHLALARDVEIVVQDERGVGNGRLLPVGPLREPAQRLADVDAIVTNAGRPRAAAAPAAGAPRQLAMWLEPTHAQRVTDGATRTLADLAALPPARLAAAAGIGNPARFSRRSSKPASVPRTRWRCPTTTPMRSRPLPRWMPTSSWLPPRTRSNAPRWTTRACGRCRSARACPTRISATGCRPPCAPANPDPAAPAPPRAAGVLL